MEKIVATFFSPFMHQGYMDTLPPTVAAGFLLARQLLLLPGQLLFRFSDISWMINDQAVTVCAEIRDVEVDANGFAPGGGWQRFGGGTDEAGEPLMRPIVFYDDLLNCTNGFADTDGDGAYFAQKQFTIFDFESRLLEDHAVKALLKTQPADVHAFSLQDVEDAEVGLQLVDNVLEDNAMYPV